MFEKLSDNLNLLMSEIRISADELARRISLPASTIKKIRNRYNPNPTLATLLPIAQYFAVTLGQLVGNEPFPENRTKGRYKQNSETIRQLPILNWDEILTWPAQNEIAHATVASEHAYSKNAYALAVEEHDWENLFPGTILLIDPSLTPEQRDYVVTFKQGQTLPTLKQVLFDEGQIYLKSVLPSGNIIPLLPEHKFLGVVVEFKKQLRKIAKSEILES
jgi:transcriptional regulator with XRE-family HTH domain